MNSGLSNFTNIKQRRKAAVAGLAAIIGLSSTFSLAASAAPLSQLESVKPAATPAAAAAPTALAPSAATSVQSAASAAPPTSAKAAPTRSGSASQSFKAPTAQRKWTPQQIAQWRAQQTAQMQYAQRLRQQQQYAQYYQNQLASKPKHQHRPGPAPDLTRGDLVLVMPKPGAEKESLNKALEEVHGHVVGSIGKGEYKVVIIQAEKGKAQQTEAKLSKDTKNFSAVNVNRPMQLQSGGYHVPTDPKISVSEESMI